VKRLIACAGILLPISGPLAGQAPHAGSLAIGLGFGFNTAGSLGVEAAVHYMAADRLALGCRINTGWGLSRSCGANIYPSPHRDWHIVAELGQASHGPRIVAGEPVSSRSWFVNLGAGVEDRIENDEGGYYRDNRVHFIIGPSFVIHERTQVDGQPAEGRWRLSPRFFNHTEVLLYPVIR
jgi:hypothetical protein